jgi:hypothetical protein
VGTNQRVVPHLILISLAVNELAATRNKRRVIEYIMQQIPSLFIELQNAQGALLKLLDARERDDRKKGYWVLWKADGCTKMTKCLMVLPL